MVLTSEGGVASLNGEETTGQGECGTVANSIIVSAYRPFISQQAPRHVRTRVLTTEVDFDISDEWSSRFRVLESEMGIDASGKDGEGRDGVEEHGGASKQWSRRPVG